MGRERASGRDVGHAESALIKHALAIGDQRDHARYILALDRAAQAASRAALPGEFVRTVPADAASAMPIRNDNSSDFRFMGASLLHVVGVALRFRPKLFCSCHDISILRFFF